MSFFPASHGESAAVASSRASGLSGQVGPLQEDGAVVQPDGHGLPAEELEVVEGASREGHAGVACAGEPLAPDAAEPDCVGAEEQVRGLLQDHGADRRYPPDTKSSTKM